MKLFHHFPYYKCHLASLPGKCEEGILILPSNFISESNAKARNLFFESFDIVDLRYWREPTFEDTNTGIVAFVFRAAEKSSTRSVPTTVYPMNQSFEMVLEKKHGWLWGQELFELIASSNDYGFRRAAEVMPNTNIIVGSLDNGAYPTGFHWNSGEPLIVKKSVITTYQIITDFDFSEEEQQQIIVEANFILQHYKDKYYSMFLSNYLGAKQKILSQSYAMGILNAAADKVLGIDNS